MIIKDDHETNNRNIMIIKEDHETNNRNIMIIMGDHDRLGRSNARHSRLGALTKGIFIVLAKTLHDTQKGAI